LRGGLVLMTKVLTDVDRLGELGWGVGQGGGVAVAGGGARPRAGNRRGRRGPGTGSRVGQGGG